MGKSEPSACPPSPVLGGGLDTAAKASEIPSGAVVLCLRHEAFIPQVGRKTIILHPDLIFFNEPSEGHICPIPGCQCCSPGVFGEDGAPQYNPRYPQPCNMVLPLHEAVGLALRSQDLRAEAWWTCPV